METKMNPNNTESAKTSTLAGPASPETGGRFRLSSGLRFARHLLEMVAAMLVGMAVLGAAVWALGGPPGYTNPLVEYGLMGAAMAAPMVAWMRYRGHSWSNGAEIYLSVDAPPPGWTVGSSSSVERGSEQGL